jgi:hypothetical protein
VYHVDCRGWSQVEGVKVVVCMVVCDEGCKVGVAVYVKDGDRDK